MIQRPRDSVALSGEAALGHALRLQLAGRYEVGEALGRGGAGTVFAAQDLWQGDSVVIKLLHRIEVPSVALLPEALLLERLPARGFPQLRDRGVVALPDGPGAYLVMRRAAGLTLDAFGKRASAERRRRAAGELVSALECLHRRGLVHGDLKPDNVLVSEEGAVTVLDLSCAAHADGDLRPRGTAEWWAPELKRGAPLSQSSDRYALGLLLRCLLDVEEVPAALLAPEPTERTLELSEILPERPDWTQGPTPQSALLEREDALQAALKHLECAEALDASPALWCVAPPGAGKSAWLDAARQRLPCELATLQLAATSSLEERVLADAIEALPAPAVFVVDDLGELRSALRLRVLQAASRPGFGLLCTSTRLSVDRAELSACITLPPLSLAASRALYVARAPDAQVEDTVLARLEGRPGRIVALAARDQVLPADYPSRELAPVALRAGCGLPLPEMPETPWLARNAQGRAVLAQPEYGSALLAQLEPDQLRAAHARCLELLRDAGAEASEWVHHAAESGDFPAIERWAAERQGDAASPEAAQQGQEVARVLERHAARVPALLRLWAADTLAPRQRWRLLASLRREAPDASWWQDYLLRLCETALECGQLPRALRYREAVTQPCARSRQLDLRLALQQAQLEQAQHLLATFSEEERAQPACLENEALLAAMRGDLQAAHGALRRAAVYRADVWDLARLRYLQVSAFVAHKGGDLDAAGGDYAAARDLALKLGAEDALVRAALNLGTAAHHAGRWGQAFEAYSQALAALRLLRRKPTQLTVSFNLARLCLDLGLQKQAAQLLNQCRDLARSLRQAFYAAATEVLAGELAGQLGDWEAARRHFGLARASLSEDGPADARALVEIKEAFAALAADDLETAERARIRAQRPRSLSAEVEAERGLLEATLALAQALAHDALRTVQQAEALLDAQAWPELRARLLALKAQCLRRLGAPARAQEATTAARALYEGIALGLDSTLGGAFWAVSERAALRDSAPEETVTGGLRRHAGVRRLLALYGRLAQQTDPQAVLEEALDASLELAEAERGFVLTRSPEGATEVVARRKLRAEADGQPNPFSQSVVSECLESGEAIVTVDAQTDSRFAAQASVHALGLRAILALPIRDSDGPRGVIYLDRRARGRAIESEDLEVLQAFADQAALTLKTTERLAQLRHQTEHLATQTQQLETLLAEREATVFSLQDQVNRRVRAEAPTRFGELVGRSEAMQPVLRLLERVAVRDATLLVQGESGTGKEVVARSVHARSPRASGPFVPINCAALPHNLLESELFGHVRGAFSGADRDRKGLFLEAHGGTLFLDEIGELPLAMQSKLLRALQEHEVRPVGGTRSQRFDARLICATNRELRAEVEAGRFREDLFYRLSVVELELPPLRERLEDLIELTQVLTRAAAKANGLPERRLAPKALDALLRYPWPGNIRELDNVLTHAVLLAEGAVVQASDLRLPKARSRRTGPASSPAGDSRAAYETQQRERIAAALATHDWNVSEVARALDMPRATLYRRLRRYGLLDRPEA